MKPRAFVPAVLAASVSAAAIAVSAQQATPQPPPPIFRSGVDLLTAQASVFDKDGNPVGDLQAADFVVRVDGAPRKVLFARFYGGARPDAARDAVAAAAFPPGQISNTTAPPGRIIVLAIDQPSMPSGGEKAALATAARFIDRLAASDAVGLVGMPTMRVDLTRDHARVREALSRIVGTKPVSGSSRQMSLEQAEAIEAGDQKETQLAMAQCNADGFSPRTCQSMVQIQAKTTVADSAHALQQSLAMLGTVVDQLAAIRGPKELVLISAGMPFGKTTVSDYGTFARRAAESQTVVYGVRLDEARFSLAIEQLGIPAFAGEPAMGPPRPAGEGLATLASMTGGGYFEASGRAAFAFDRIQIELNNFYELGIESRPADANGKAHAIEIKASRPGVSVRTRPDIVPAARDTKASADALGDALRQPIDVTELPVTIATYATRAADDRKKHRILVSAEIGGGALRAPVDWGFVVLSSGKTVADGHRREQPVPGARVDANAYTTLDPGSYRLRFAATDGSGRTGSIEVPLVVAASGTGELQTSDLIVGEMVDGHFRPRSRVAGTADVVALLELYAADPKTLDRVDVVLQLTADGSGDAMGSASMELQQAASADVRAAQARLNVEALAPGRYTANAVVSVDGRAVARVTRTVDIVR